MKTSLLSPALQTLVDGSDRDTSIRRVTLTDSERIQLESSYAHLAFPDEVGADHERFITDATRWLVTNAPRRILREIQDWKSDPRHAGALMFDNLGTGGELPDTPTNGRRSPDKYNTYSESVSVAISNLLGQIIAFEPERNGDIVQDLTPVSGRESSLTNLGTRSLGWHPEHAATHLAFRESTPVLAHLVFFHLRASQDGTAKTLVADLRAALRLLSTDTLHTLASPEFRVKPPKLVASALSEDRREYPGVPLLNGMHSAGFLQGALYGDLTVGLTGRAERAIAELKSSLDSVHYAITTNPGRLVILDNRLMLHARAPFEPRYDGQDRWLQRTLVTENLRQFERWQRNATRVLAL